MPANIVQQGSLLPEVLPVSCPSCLPHRSFGSLVGGREQTALCIPALPPGVGAPFLDKNSGPASNREAESHVHSTPRKAISKLRHSISKKTCWHRLGRTEQINITHPHICTHMCNIYRHVHICTHAHIYIHAHSHTYIHTCTHSYALDTHACMHAFSHMNTHTHTHLHATYIYAHTFANMHTYA